MTKYRGEAIDDGLVGAVAEALANQRRRAVITLLCRRPATTTELAEHVGAALPTMHQHLESLRAAGLVSSVKHGRTVTHTVDLTALNALTDWIAARRSFWTEQLESLDVALAAGPS